MKKLAVDTETTGLDFFHGCRPFMVTACDGSYNYHWIGEVNPYTREVFWKDEDLDDIQCTLESHDTLIFHNAKFDLRGLACIGIEIDHLWGRVEDTILASHLLCSGDSHGLKDLAVKYLRYWDDDEKELARQVHYQRDVAAKQGWAIARKGHPHFPGHEGKEIWKQDYWLAMDACLKYGHGDVERTYLLWEVFSEGMDQEGLWDIYQVRKKLLKITYDMQSVGINLYTNRCDRRITEMELRVEELRAKLQHSVGIKYQWDPAKKKHVEDLLYHKLKLPVLFFTKTGEKSTSIKAVEYYLKQEDNPVLKQLAEYKQEVKKLSIAKSYKKWQHEGSIHSSLNITGTRETRQSSNDPNQQNNPPSLDDLFGPEPGYIWLDADLVNIELRIWAYLVKNKKLIERFENGESVHMMILSVLHPEIYDPLVKEMGIADAEEYIKEHFKPIYKKMKNGNFSRIYGAGENKANTTYGVDNACEIIDREFPGISAFLQKCMNEVMWNFHALDRPCVKTMGGYPLDVPLDQPYKAANFKIQGTAGLIMNYIMIDVKENPYYIRSNSQMIAQIHDSLKTQIPDSEHPLYRTLAPEAYEAGITTLEVVDSIIDTMESSGRRFIPSAPVSYKIIYPGDDN